MPRLKPLPIVTAANYYDVDMALAYMGASQYKAFCECEAGALAEVRGEVEGPSSDALLVGSYVDAHFSGEEEIFFAEHPEVYGRGGLRAPFKNADTIIARIEKDPLFSRLLEGNTQVIRTGEIAGVPFKIKMDSYLDGVQCEALADDFPALSPLLAWAPGAIVDLKVMKDFKRQWVDGQGKVSFIQRWGYDIQGAIYQAIEGRQLPFFIAAATKEEDPDIEIFHVPQEEMDARLMEVEALAPRFAAIKRGEIEPMRCGKCAYCRRTKVLTGAVDYRFYDMEETE